MHHAACSGKIVEVFDRRLQKRRDLVDEGARASGATAVHAHVGHVQPALRVSLEEDHLRILAAQLDGASRLRVVLRDGDGVRNDLLHIGKVQKLGDGLAARSAHRYRKSHFGKLLRDFLQNAREALRLVRVMASVDRVERFIRCRINDDGLGRGRADVKAHVAAATDNAAQAHVV